MADRKKDHIELAFRSQVKEVLCDKRFHYEPLLGYCPSEERPAFPFLGKTLRTPIWVSSSQNS